MKHDLSKFEPSKTEPDESFSYFPNYKYDIKIVTRGRCMACGKDLTEGLFFCKECEDKRREFENE